MKRFLGVVVVFAVLLSGLMVVELEPSSQQSVEKLPPDPTVIILDEF